MTAASKAVLLSLLVMGLLVALLALGPGSRRSREPVVLYCAAGVQPPVERIVREYEARHGIAVQVQYGGSGTLLSNLQVSKRGDLFLAADGSYIDIAREKRLVEEAIPIAWQTPAIAVPKGNPKGIDGLEALLRRDVRVGLGNPDAASIGRTVKEVLARTGQWEALERRVREHGVFKPTVPDIANDLLLGTIDAGIVWDSMLGQYPGLERVPSADLAGARQAIQVAVLSSSSRPAQALHLARYLAAADRGLLVFAAAGYETARGDAWADRPEIVLFSGGVNRLAIQETLAAFQAREGVSIVTSYAGCGMLVGEMRAGKRPDAYFACDTSYMKEVQDLFLDQVPISETDMVLLTRRGNPLGIRGLSDLARPGVKVAVANARYSALGGLTESLLGEAGLLEAVRANTTYGDAPTADYLTVRIRTGMEDVAIVYRANTVAVKDELDVVPIDHPAAKAVQPLAAARSTRYPRLVARLEDAIRSAESRARFERSGFRFLALPGRAADR